MIVSSCRLTAETEFLLPVWESGAVPALCVEDEQAAAYKDMPEADPSKPFFGRNAVGYPRCLAVIPMI